MTDWLPIAAVVAPTLAALGSTLVSLHNKRQIREVHLSLNSRLDALIRASNAQGRIDERNDRIAETSRATVKDIEVKIEFKKP